MRSRVVLVKLAAIGDVAVACHALNEFYGRFETGHRPIELHWIIDGNLVGLARALLHPSVETTWHAVDAARIFQGRAMEKAVEALKLVKTVAGLQPDQLLLLHRDWRYKALLRPVFRGAIHSVTRESLQEVVAYQRLFDVLAKQLHMPLREVQPKTTAPAAPSGRIGVLVGGARSQKVDFAEKRWPRIPELVRLLVDRTQSQVVLFGGPEDTAAADTAMAGLSSTTRIENLVGKVPLADIPGILAGLDAFISIDSGLAHIAALVMTAKHQKIITLFGPTNPRIWAPTATGAAVTKLHYKARPCSPCYSNDGSFKPCHFEGEYFQHCMTDISAEEVLKSLY